MFFKSSPNTGFVSVRCAATIWFCLATTAASGQTSRPARLSHEAALARAAKRPLIRRVLKTPAGAVLNEQQRADIARSDQEMAEARAARRKGAFSVAAARARRALEIRQRLLGPGHHLVISSRVFANNMEDWGSKSSSVQEKLVATDKELASAEDFQKKGEYAAARQAAKRALATREELLGGDHVEIGLALWRLGSILTDLEAMAEADQMMNRAGPLIEKAYGTMHPETARLLDRVGWLRFFQSRQGGSNEAMAKSAVTDLSRAVRIYSQSVGETADAAEALDNLGSAVAAIGNLRSAWDMKLRALVIRRQVLGPEDREVGVSLSNLAWLYDRLGRSEEVIPLRKKALAIFEKELGPMHPYCFLERGNLARACQREGESEQAIEIFEQMVAMDEKRTDRSDPSAVVRLARLGGAYLEVGRIGDAAKVFDRGYKEAQELFDNGLPIPATNTIIAIAGACRKHRMLEDALRFHEKVVEWDNKTRGKSDSLTLALRTNTLGALYIDMGRLDDAKRVLIESIGRIRKLEGNNRLQLAPALLNLANTEEKLGNLDEAEGFVDEAVRITETELQRRVPATAYALLQMGRINTLQDRFIMAKFSLDEAQEILSNFTEHDPYGNISILRAQARYHARKGEPEKADEFLRSALARCREWAEKKESVHVKAATTETLHQLLEGSASGGLVTAGERTAWRSELRTLLEKLRDARALTHEQGTWLKNLQS